MSKFQLNSCSRWNCLKARGKTIYIVIDTRQYIKILRSSCCCCCSNAIQIKGDLIKIYPQQTVTMRRARNAPTEIPIGRANSLTLITILILQLFSIWSINILLISYLPLQKLFSTHWFMFLHEWMPALDPVMLHPVAMLNCLAGTEEFILHNQNKQTGIWETRRDKMQNLKLKRKIIKK